MVGRPGPGEHCRRSTRIAWGVHAFTTSGVVIGMLALQAVFDGNAERAIWFLLATQIIDGIDGPMARQLHVREHEPRIDGYVLDLVIDYVTCVVVPAVFMHQFGLVPEGISLPLAGAVVFFSAIWFSRTDMMTDDLWFQGFPATWNLVLPSLLVAGTGTTINTIVVVGLCVLMLTDVRFPHVMRTLRWRPASLAATGLWLGALLVGSLRLPDTGGAPGVVIGLCALYFVVLCVRASVVRRAPAPLTA